MTYANAKQLGPAVQARPAKEKCRLCGCSLDADESDDFSLLLCGACAQRPEARRLGVRLRPSEGNPSSSAILRSAREFTLAEKSLIQKIHGYMPPQQLLGILNERLACDLGPDATPYTMEQLYAEIGGATAAAPAGGRDWANLRKLLANARRAGTLQAITEQTINDFALVFSLNQKQLLVLKDIVLEAKGD